MFVVETEENYDRATCGLQLQEQANVSLDLTDKLLQLTDVQVSE